MCEYTCVCVLSLIEQMIETDLITKTHTESDIKRTNACFQNSNHVFNSQQHGAHNGTKQQHDKQNMNPARDVRAGTQTALDTRPVRPGMKYCMQGIATL